MIIVIDFFTVGVFMLIAAVLGYSAITTLQGLMVPLSVILFVGELIAAIYFFVRSCKAATYGEDQIKPLPSFLSSALCMFVTYLCLKDICSYDSGFWGVITMLFGLAFEGSIGGGMILSWAALNLAPSWKTALIEIACAGVILFMFLI